MKTLKEEEEKEPKEMNSSVATKTEMASRRSHPMKTIFEEESKGEEEKRADEWMTVEQM